MAGSAAAGLPSGVTAVLAGLWLVAALLHGPRAAMALALDPGQDGSLAAWWAGGQLGLALAVALASPRTRCLALAAAVLLAGEVGELHIRVAELLAGAAERPSWLPWLKAGAALGLAAVAFGALWHARHDVCCTAGLAWLGAAGGSALAADLLGCLAPSPWLAAGEEWAELVAYALLLELCLRMADPSRFDTMFDRSPKVQAPAQAPGWRRLPLSY